MLAARMPFLYLPVKSRSVKTVLLTLSVSRRKLQKNAAYWVDC